MSSSTAETILAGVNRKQATSRHKKAGLTNDKPRAPRGSRTHTMGALKGR